MCGLYLTQALTHQGFIAREENTPHTDIPVAENIQGAAPGGKGVNSAPVISIMIAAIEGRTMTHCGGKRRNLLFVR